MKLTDEERRAVTALLDYKQADEDGVMVTTSRQAIHEVWAILDRLTTPPPASDTAHSDNAMHDDDWDQFEEQVRNIDKEPTTLEPATVGDDDDLAEWLYMEFRRDTKAWSELDHTGKRPWRQSAMNFRLRQPPVSAQPSSTPQMGTTEDALAIKLTELRLDNPGISGRHLAQALLSSGALVKVPTKALSDVATERARQVSAEGWTPEHDDEHKAGEMALAAGCYALNSADGCVKIPTDTESRARTWIPQGWPWLHRWWKPKDPRNDLVRAGALILAEIERLDRAALFKSTEAGA